MELTKAQLCALVSIHLTGQCKHATSRTRQRLFGLGLTKASKDWRRHQDLTFDGWRAIKDSPAISTTSQYSKANGWKATLRGNAKQVVLECHMDGNTTDEVTIDLCNGNVIDECRVVHNRLKRKLRHAI